MPSLLELKASCDDPAFSFGKTRLTWINVSRLVLLNAITRCEFLHVINISFLHITNKQQTHKAQIQSKK